MNVPIGVIPTILGAAVAVGCYAIFVPQSSLMCPVTWRGRRDGPPRVAITFDDGPWPAGTGPILDTLRDLACPATFFVIGANAARWPELVARMHAEGHSVGNHSYDHPHMGVFRRGRYWMDQLRRTDSAIVAAGVPRPTLFRPPIGHKTVRLAMALRATGQRAVTWSRRAADGIPTSTDRILARIVPRARAGDIIVLHDGLEPRAIARPAPRDVSPTVRAVRPMVEGLRARGLAIVPLEELIGVPVGG
ncbi:MAG: polysaccharide deacetylase family protein [Phycisphaerae bacterium]|nr:polysaccharide deacetylase family protein [Phycisphaerae bacterium]